MSASAVPTMLIVSGMSGSGKSVALQHPRGPRLLLRRQPAGGTAAGVRAPAAERRRSAPSKIAVVIDVRSLSDLAEVPTVLSRSVRSAPIRGCCSSKRATRCCCAAMPTPAAATRSATSGWSLADAISLDRQALKPLRQIADIRIDTSELNVHQMRRRVLTEFGLSGDRAVAAVRVVRLPPRRAARCRLRVRRAGAAESALGCAPAAAVRARSGGARVPRRRNPT